VIDSHCLALYEDPALYDAEFATRAHEIPFYIHQSRACGGAVLELACGTGRLTLPIDAAGVPIVGVDVAPKMIDRAREKATAAGRAIEWHVADIRTMALGRRFHLLFIESNALQHLHDVDSLRSFFRRAREHLLPCGRLIVDVFNPSIPKLARTLDERHPHKTFAAPDGGLVEVEVASEYLRETQVLHFLLTYRRGTLIVGSKDVRMRCFFPEELVALCRWGGFEVEARLGDYDGSPFRGDAPQQILLLSKGPD
jgi:SAM-dependent methyltransferase